MSRYDMHRHTHCYVILLLVFAEKMPRKICATESIDNNEYHYFEGRFFEGIAAKFENIAQ